MPHLKLRRLSLPPLPWEEEGVRLLSVARNVQFEKEAVIRTQAAGHDFLLQVKPARDGHILVKADKISRPTSAGPVKKALKVLAEYNRETLVGENISGHRRNTEEGVAPCVIPIDRFVRLPLPDKPIWIEVGFGSGRHLLYQAKNHPDIHLIGIEIHRPSLEQVMKRVEAEKLENVWLVDYDARLLMETMPTDSVERIFVHFPVPWDKKPHRRVVSPRFHQEAMRVLEPGGTLEVRTDSDNYYRYTLEVFSMPEKSEFTVFKNRDLAVTSKYEDRWRRMEKDIYDIVAVCGASQSRQARGDAPSFDFDCRIEPKALASVVPAAATVLDGYFFHPERLYLDEKGEGFLRLSFGGFDRPEHKYLRFEGKDAAYYPHAPVPTRTNLEAHHMIRNWLCSLPS